jgi:hypothetical protein
MAGEDGKESRPMMRIALPPEPPGFDERCRVPGNQWLGAHPDPEEKPPNRWREFIPDLCAGFLNRCGYLAMWDLNGTVDHYLSVENHRHLAYEWSNYRYATGWLNSSKQKLDREVLDPLLVRDEWFEIDLASLHLRMTGAVPPRFRDTAEFTVHRLKLDYGPRVIRQRTVYRDLFERGEMGLADLDREAPMLATAVRRERLLARLSGSVSVSRTEVDAICETVARRSRELLRIWRGAGHIISQGRGLGVRYRRL